MISSCQSNPLSKVLPEAGDTETIGKDLSLHQVVVPKRTTRPGHLMLYMSPIPAAKSASSYGSVYQVTSSQLEFVCLHNQA